MILRTELRVLRVLVGCEELLLWGVGRHASYSFKMGDALGEETFEAIVCDNSSAADPLAANFDPSESCALQWTQKLRAALPHSSRSRSRCVASEPASDVRELD